MAISDPLSNANNKIGIHVLSPEEISEASILVNNQEEASWGYVTIPIQATDRDRKKWGEFMVKCAKLKLIPIIRVATVPEGSNWVTPNNYDLIDFANFLNELDWPIKNRYVIIFNEVNHAGEYGGMVSPEHYVQILVNAINIFKERNSDFFILPSAMDNATVNNGSSIYWKEYLLRMYRERPDVFRMIDGWNSHAYPNPAFSGKVTDYSEKSIRSFESDLKFIKDLGARDLPIFITETGWDMEKLGEDVVAENLKNAFELVWNREKIVAVTPFLLRAGEGPFVKFSFIKKDGAKSQVYLRWQSLATIKGNPKIDDEQLNEINSVTEENKNIESNSDLFMMDLGIWKNLWSILMNWLLK